ncbi:uncharacterized protein LOC118264186 isoform X4 [Spodoptera frugiperda]|uniref:Uncharacterized protein LOC118264186 isoform X4 n=1 Tax=Spodoptera frugiperda TaxID=7108 RepID=A0A9R0EGH5_SPOFR|nr:uncharacterized protein LOC118264186 isoform X4 [Spodoptera frugiperda]
MSADVLAGVAEEYLRLRSRSGLGRPASGRAPTCPVMLDRPTLSGDQLPTCEPLCCIAYDRRPVGMGDGVACGSLARLSAYFSMRPPAVPVQLVPVSAPLNLPALPPRLSTSSPPSHTADLATHLNNESATSDVAEGAQHRQHLQRQQRRPRATPAAAATAKTRGHASSDNYQVTVYRNVSSNSCQKGEGGHETDEWLGGVRALRDSHVRLVLRQLRHIERLNRALDRTNQHSPHRPRSPRSPQSHRSARSRPR